MQGLVEYLQLMAEIQQDKLDLMKLGLTQEEVEGYIEFYADKYFPPSTIPTKDLA